jgi:hypothetical protein
MEKQRSSKHTHNLPQKCVSLTSVHYHTSFLLQYEYSCFPIKFFIQHESVYKYGSLSKWRSFCL